MVKIIAIILFISVIPWTFILYRAIEEYDYLKLVEEYGEDEANEILRRWF